MFFVMMEKPEITEVVAYFSKYISISMLTQ